MQGNCKIGIVKRDMFAFTAIREFQFARPQDELVQIIPVDPSCWLFSAKKKKNLLVSIIIIMLRSNLIRFSHLLFICSSTLNYDLITRLLNDEYRFDQWLESDQQV